MNDFLKRSQELIQNLELQKHPEGGYYKENYRSDRNIYYQSENLDFPNGRSFGTAIYFLLKENEFSAFHRIKSDEIWHFYEGFPLEIISIDVDGNLERQILGNNLKNGESFQATVKGGKWFASRLLKAETYALVGCTVAPGFDFQDFEMADRKHLIELFPQHEEIIKELSR